MDFTASRGKRFLLAAGAVAAVAALGAGLGVYLAFVRDLPDLRDVTDYRPPLSTRVLDRDGAPIGEFFRERRRLTRLEEVPQHVVRAFVAGEDSTFFEHSGIDLMSILRAAWVNLRAGGEIRQGGSTITQQMVKGLLLSPERSLRRKVREMLLARRIEKRFSKEEILYFYLNQIYFGHGAYGIGEAARLYFGKEVGELSVSEGAQLAGLPKAPSRYSPHRNPDQAEERRRYVLERMHEDDFLDEETYRAALAERPELHDPPDAEDSRAAAYFTEAVRRRLFDELGGEAVLTGGLVVETTLDARLQRAASRAVQEGLHALCKRQGYRGPLRHVEPDALEQEIARVGKENRLLRPEPGEPELEAQAEEPVAAETAAETRRSARLASGEPLLGVVTAVDGKADRARVALAPDLEAEIQLEDASWARPADPARAPYRMRSIARILQVGDVALFRAKGADPEAQPLRLALEQEPLVEGALFSFDVASGEVLALVGGYDFERSQFDRVTQARRQPGSAFKPLIYGAALARGYTPASIVFDRPVVYVDESSGFVWRPRNYGRSFYGPITLREALARSVNNATVHLFRDVGPGFVIDYARQLGIESPLVRDLSLALGSSGVSLLELTRAYAVFPNGGRRVEPVFVRRVLDRDGQVLLENLRLSAPEDEKVAAVGAGPEAPDAEAEAPPDPDRAIPASEAYLVTSLMRAVVTDPDGTGWRLRALRRPVAGKTGTTNDQGDAWFLGFSPEIATGVWVGHDDTHFLGWGETGSRAAAPIWVDYMEAALRDRPVVDFPVPDDIVFARIDRKSGLLADASSEQAVFQAFQAGTVPDERASQAQRQSEGRRLLRMDAF